MSAGIAASRVGQLLGVSADTVRRHHGRWMAEKGFPRPLFEDGLLRWDEDAVAEWKRRRSQPDQATASAGLEPASMEPDWAEIARRRGAALDAGRDPDLVAV